MIPQKRFGVSARADHGEGIIHPDSRDGEAEIQRRRGCSQDKLPDGASHGLRLVLHPTGRKSWIVRYRFKGRQRKLTLPGFPSLAEARKACSEAMLEVARGVDPATKHAHEAALAGEEAARQSADTLDHWIKEFITRHVSKRRENTIIQYEHILNRIALPAWRDRSVHEIKRGDVVHLLNTVAKDRPVMANRVWAVVHKLFAWMVAQSVLEHSPVSGVERPAGKRRHATASCPMMSCVRCGKRAACLMTAVENPFRGWLARFGS